MTTKYEIRLKSELTRYMQLGQLIDVLSQGLFLPRIDMFEDPWEGHVFHSVTAKIDNKDSIARLINSSKRWIYALCWHAADHESYTMWRLYGREGAIAIHASPEAVKGLMPVLAKYSQAQPSLLAAVDYVIPIDGAIPERDPDAVYSISWEDPSNTDRTMWRNVMQQCFCLKPMAYEYEKEVRLLALDQAALNFWEQMIQYDPKCGIRVPIDPAKFISSITVSPWAQDWFVESVRSVVKKYNVFPEKVKKSSMHDAPRGDLE